MTRTQQILAAGVFVLAGLGLGLAAMPLIRDGAPPEGEQPPKKAASAERSDPVRRTASPAPAIVRACADCATVIAVNAIDVDGRGTGLGGVAGGVVGAAVGSQIGGGDGRRAAQVIGAVGGALAGHRVEKELRSHTAYDVKLRMSDGSVRTLRVAELPAFRAGDPVRVDGERLRAP